MLLTGSPSNVHPSHFGETVHDPALPLDPERDAWTLPLIRRALARGMPLLAICRGTQEVNVALGGTLHQAVQEQPGLNDHRAPEGEPRRGAVRPGAPGRRGARRPARAASPAAPASRSTRCTARASRQLAPGLRVEAVAPDGLVEAFTQPAAPGFNLCVQWHPEWQAAGNPVSVQLFNAFGVAVRAYRDRVRGPLPRRSTV